MKSMMKRAIFCFMIFLILGGCAGQFKEQRNLSRPLVALGMSKIQENDIQGAIIELRKAKNANPSDPEVYYGFAFAYWKSGKFDQALENADEAIALGDKLELEHPGLKGEAYNLKGTIFSSQGKYNEAMASYKKALTDELYQTPEYAQHNIATLYLEKKNLQLAFETTEKTLDRNSHYAPAWHLLSKIYVAQGRPDDAIDALKHAILEFPGYSEAHWDLAMLYLQMRAPGKAKAELTKVVEIDPGGYYGTMAVGKLKEME
jgi:type IV pilus assembly protein PilF